VSRLTHRIWAGSSGRASPATRGNRSCSSPVSRPALAAAASRAASVGSPTAVHASLALSGGRSAASLHSAPAVSRRIRSGAWPGGERAPGPGQLAVRCVPGAGDLRLGAVRGPGPANHHVALGQGAGLVAAEDGYRPQRLHGREPPDERVTGGHPAGAERQGQGDYRGQGFWHGGDDQADRGDDHQLGALAPGQADDQDDGGQHHRCQGQHAAHAGQPPLQGGEAVPVPHQAGNPPYRAGRPCGGHHRLAPATDDRGARGHGMAACRLIRRHRLARQPADRIAHS
jgi:hypothetical protein